LLKQQGCCRSFVAQRIPWENGWSALFESPTVWQDHNDHNLMRDLRDEVPGYLHAWLADVEGIYGTESPKALSAAQTL
jgi:hypothetical protein